jgi:type I restriction enzyme R subunit
MAGSNEAFSRVLIDKALEASSWNLLDPHAVRFEFDSRTGRADYLLVGKRGPLAVLEAKRDDVDPYTAKEQARGYADNLHAPFVILSNGREHWFWNLERDDADAFRIERLPSAADLERLRLKNLQPPRPLMTEQVTADYLSAFRSDIQLRRYQVNAMDTVGRLFDEQQRRKFLMEMATGTGKTLLCAALIRRFLKTRNAERVLFVVDRIELAKQTMEDFNTVLREYSPVIFRTAKPHELMASSVVVATIQSLMVNNRYRREFTPFYFDLVINDEAHRSIYGDAREVVQFFQATRVGLTATPKAYLKNIDLAKLGVEDPKTLEARQLRDTYHYFGCEPGVPTFRYDIIDAVKDPEGPFLCLPKIIDIRSDITTKALAENGWAVTIDEHEESYKIQHLEKRIFTPRRNELMCESFLKHAQRDPAGNLGRSIIFCVNQRHASNITQMLNKLQPNAAVLITSHVRGASQIAKDFRDGKRQEPVAVSVDMLSTGYNVKPLLNVVLMRPVFSPTEYIQIKGRGTRLFTFKIGNTEYEKKHFFLLDFCGVADYFEEEYNYSLPLELPREPKGEPPGPGPGPGPEPNPPEPPGPGPTPPRTIPVWEGVDTVVSEEVRIVGLDGEKVDVMTFRGSFEKDVADLSAADPRFKQAVADEDDDTVDEIVTERLLNKPDMYYTPGKLVLSYGVPAATPAFVYNALGKKPLPTKEEVVETTVDSIAARFNLRYQETKWVKATADLIADDANALRKFMEGDLSIFASSQFNQLGGLQKLAAFDHRDHVFEALRTSVLARQSFQSVVA